MSYFGKFKGSYAGSWWGTVVAIFTPSIAGVCEALSRFAYPARATDGTPSQTVNSAQIYRNSVADFVPLMEVSLSSLNPVNTNHISQNESYTTAVVSQNTHKAPQNESNSLIYAPKRSNFVTDSTAENT